jgi:transcriptional regulator with XRE-family HTH domain
MDREQRLIANTARYLALLEAGSPPQLAAFVALAEPDVRAELAPLLEALLAEGEPLAMPLSAAEQAAAEHAERRVRQRVLARARQRTLTEARKERRLTVGALAAQLNLPVDLLARIERGGVLPETIPARLVALLARALGEAEDAMLALLAAPPPAAAVRLHARDGAAPAAEAHVSFAAALRQSAATPAQRATWDAEA